MRWPRDARGLRGEGRGGRSGRISLGDGGGAWSRLGISAVLGKMQIESTVFSIVIAGLNNQRGGERLLFRSRRVIFWNIPKMRGHLVDSLV
jgi:hypothetical protein